MRRQFSAMGVLLVVTLISTCDSPSNRPSVRAQPPAPELPRAFDPSQVLFAEDSPAHALLELSGEERLRACEALLREDEDPMILWLAARAAESAEQPDRAVVHWTRLSQLDHGLAPWATLRLAKLLVADSPAEAATVLLPVSEEAWAGQEEARALRGAALAHAGDAAAVPMLRELILEAPEDRAVPSIARPLAMLLSRSEDATDREEAISLYRRISVYSLNAGLRQSAEERIGELVSELPRDRRAALRSPSADEAFAHADVLYRSMRHRDAENAFAEVATHSAATPELRCRARMMQGKAMLRRRERDRGATHMEAVANDCEETDVRAWALFHAARAHARRSRNREALRLYDALVEAAPEHRLGDDGLYRGSLSAQALGDEEGAAARLLRLASDFPDGDMRGEARFKLAWRLREKGLDPANRAQRQQHLSEALRHLEASINEGPGEDAEDIHGRARYWRARVLEDLEAEAPAIQAYRNLVEEWPLAYYTQRSLSRLDIVAPEAATEMRASLRQDPQALEPLTFDLRPEMETESFQNAILLLRLGETTYAEAEFGAAGFTGSNADQDALWLVAACLDRAGEHPAASRLVRRRLGGLLGEAPIGEGYHKWRIAYPNAFSPLIERAAEGAGVPAAFVRAIAREESAFNPNAVSVAHAYGLIQLIRPTAQRFARELGLPATPASLKNPETNLRIGSAFISFLWNHYEDNPSIVPSAYNAGEAAVDRWLRERGDLELDAFIETIPYDETRRYTRRVLQTFGTYSWLDGGTLPPIPSTQLPPARR